MGRVQDSSTGGAMTSEDGRQDEIAATLGLGARRRRTPLRFWPFLAVLAALGAGVWWWQGAGGASDAPKYVTADVTKSDVTVSVTATGTVEPTNVVDISSELSGTLAEVLVDFNDEVRAGDMLARMDTSKLAAQVAVQQAGLMAAEARVQSATATLSEAMEAYQTARKLDERGVTSSHSLVVSKAALDRSLAALQVANADRALAEASLDLSQAELDKGCICSPIDGVILDRKAEAGQIVAASLSAPVLFTVAGDLTKMEVQVAVDEADIGRLVPGNRATFTVEAYDERVFEAEVTWIRYASETVDGVVTYRATLALNNADLALRPGMTATAEITVAEIRGALVVPNAALRYAPPVAVEDEGSSGGGLLGMIMPSRPRDTAGPVSRHSVWVLRDGTAQEVAVTPGDSDGTVTVIAGGDLAEGDRVILRQEG
jgi:HlyD family secretion protein